MKKVELTEKQKEYLEEKYILSMDDVRKTIHNLDHKKKNDFMENFQWKETQELFVIVKKQDIGKWNGNKVAIGSYSNCDKYYEDGIVVFINDEFKYIVSIYEMHYFDFDEEEGLITISGHEEVINLFLHSGKIKGMYTH